MQQKDSSKREEVLASENGTNDSQTIFPFKNPALELARQDDPTITTTPSTTLRQYPRNAEELSNERNATDASSRHGRFSMQGGGTRASLVELLAEEPKEKKTCFNFFSHYSGFHFSVIVLPTFISMWYSAAVLFPPDYREKAWFFLWDNGVLTYDDEGRPILCPRASICSEGVIQVILIALARLSAFASYGVMSVTFVSKMHSTVHFLSSSYLRTFIPFEDLHHVHVNTGKWYGIIAFLHMITHYIRYIVRQDANQLWTTVHISGLLGIFGMSITIVSMTYLKKFKTKISYEVRFKIHWLGFFTLAVALLFHTRRSRTIVLIFGGLWALDYLYGVVCKTHSLEVVEFTPLPSGSGVQMLWRNPEGFRVRSGEYVKVQLPWLPKGSNEWHPFSVYLKEKTQVGLDSLVQMPDSTIWNDTSNGATDNIHLEFFVDKVLKSEFRANLITSSIVHEAREDLSDRYKTTQVFICAVGDWSESLVNSISNEHRASWVRGPFTSPYHVAQDFSHLVLVASGIGITPALGVMGQYPGFSRTKILMWSTRDLDMLKFFAPLLNDAHFAIIFYTGKTKLSASDITEFDLYGNIYIQIGRPKKPNGLDVIISCVIVKLEHIFDPFGEKRSLEDLELLRKQAWCVLYCGGAKAVVEELTEFTTKHQIGWEFEQFDW